MGMAQKEFMKKLIKIRLPRWAIPTICIILVLGIIINVGSVLFQQRGKYSAHDYWQRYDALKQAYLDSQYANKHPKGFLPDETVYAYAGGAFVQGANPLLIIPDAPPLGKYFIGLSILTFNNEHDVILVFTILSLVLLFILSRQIFSSIPLSLIPVFLLSSELLFKNQMVYTPLFDIMQLAFILAIFIVFNIGFTAKRKDYVYFGIVCLLLGCFISIKFFASGITILVAWYIVLLSHKKNKKALMLTVFTPLIPIALLLSYARVFAFGYSLRKLVGAQKWIFIYHQGQIMK